MSSADAESYAYTVMTAICMLLVLLPLPWHWQARNSGTLLFIFWVFVGNLNYFVNSIIWRGNMDDPAPVWCDISSKIAIGLGVAYPACSLCINRRLCNIATSRHVSSPNEKRKQLFIDLAIALGIPFLIMSLHIIVQGHRYDIIEDVGCSPTLYFSVLSIVLVSMWPIVLGLISFVYSTLTIRAFLLQRRAFKAIVGRHTTTLNLSRYFRLMALAATDVCLSVPFSVYILYANLRRGLMPWTSWSDVHWDFNRTPRAPLWVIKELGGWPALEVNRWSSPVLAIIFFLFFGLAGESLAAYKRFFTRITKPLQTWWGRLATRFTFLRQFNSPGNRKFDGGVTLPSTPGVRSTGWQSEAKSRFTEPPTPVSALKASRHFARRESDLESGLDYYFEERIEGDGEKAGQVLTFTPPSLPPRALSTSSLRDKELPQEPLSPPVFDIRRFSSSLSIANEFPHSDSDLPSAADSSAFPLDLSSFPFPSASLLTPQALSTQFRNSMPTSYSFAPPTASLGDERQFTMTSPPPGLADARFSEIFRHSHAGVMSPSQSQTSDSPVSSETGMCRALFPPEPN